MCGSRVGTSILSMLVMRTLVLRWSGHFIHINWVIRVILYILTGSSGSFYTYYVTHLACELINCCMFEDRVWDKLKADHVSVGWSEWCPGVCVDHRGCVSPCLARRHLCLDQTRCNDTRPHSQCTIDLLVASSPMQITWPWPPVSRFSYNLITLR